MKATSAKGTPAAFFDVDGTLGSTNVVQAYADLRIRGLSLLRRWAWLTVFLPKLPYYGILDTMSRNRFSEVFYRNYAKFDQSDLDLWAADAVERYWAPRLFPEALEQLRDHRAQGHRVILVSGGIEPMLRPLAAMLETDALIATRPEMEGTRLTGRLVDGPMGEERKAQATKEVSEALGIDLGQSYAYGDSYADRSILASVGHAIAVNPDRRLRKMARSRGWQIRIWRRR